MEHLEKDKRKKYAFNFRYFLCFICNRGKNERIFYIQMCDLNISWEDKMG